MFSNSGRPNGPTSCFAVRNPSGHKLLFGGTASSAKGVVKTSTPQLYPMYLISVADFLKETTLRPHQHLLVDRKLELHGAQHTGRVIYVSHQGFAWGEGDPDGLWLRELQGLLRRMIAGECKPITPDWNATIMQPGSLPIVGSSQLKASIPHMYLWIDYCSMPQDLRDDDGGMVVGQAGGGMDAIRSTPSYIERTDLVLVMTPPATHADTGRACAYCSWRGRGSCRFEFAASLLAPGSKPLMVTRSAEDAAPGPTMMCPAYLGPLDASFLQVALSLLSLSVSVSVSVSLTLTLVLARTRTLQVACAACKDASFRGPTSKSDARQGTIGMTASPPRADGTLPSVAVKPLARVASAPPIMETTALSAHAHAMQAELEAEKAKNATLEEQLAVAKQVRASAKATQNDERKLDGRASLRSAPAPAPVPGVLRVQVISATGIPAADGNGLSDPYAKVFLGGMPDVVRKTHVVKETLDPEWGEQFDFHGTLYEMTSAPLEVELSDQDNGGLSKQVLGRASLPFGKEVVSGKAMEGALNTQGSVKLFASFAPLKLVLSSNVHIKKKGISGGRYTMHTVTLSHAEGFDGWSSYRLAYRDTHDVEHAATVIGMSDVAPMRYELTILTHENQGYSIRCDNNPPGNNLDPNPDPSPSPDPIPNPNPNAMRRRRTTTVSA